MNAPLHCDSCDADAMVRLRVRRHGWFLVGVGFVFAAVAAVAVVSFVQVDSTRGEIETRATRPTADVESELRRSRVPDAVVAKVMSERDLSIPERLGLTERQLALVNEARRTLDAKRLAAGGLGELLFCAGATAVVTGTLSWLCLRRMTILHCNGCGRTEGGRS